MNRTILVILTLVFAVSPVVAQIAYPQPGTVISYSTGFSSNSARVYLSSPSLQNGCTRTDGGYVTDPSNPGNSAFMQALLTAFINGNEVNLAISGCSADGWPLIILVALVP